MTIFPLHCELFAIPSPHLSQLYDGFLSLAKKKIITLTVKKLLHTKAPLLKVLVNKKTALIYDMLDGLNWIDGSIEDNLNYCANHLHADFYFKRSFTHAFSDFFSTQHSRYPLGLNYDLTPSSILTGSCAEHTKELLRKLWVKKIMGKNAFMHEDFECSPNLSKSPKILFNVRLWDPTKESSLLVKQDYESVNNARIMLIRTCKKEFGDIFSGGVEPSPYSKHVCKDLLLSPQEAKRNRYLDRVKNHDIGIATTGLHGSIGWKFGEYVAASRAIVSEPLNTVLPGNFAAGKNYLAFTTADELIGRIDYLLTHKEEMLAMMQNNYRYYHSFLRPDKLVLNTLVFVVNTLNGTSSNEKQN